MHISVLTPSYNSAKYLERALGSVETQDYKDWEHIVVDGGSTDGTLNILEKHPRIQWVSETDHGQADAMNKAFARSQGEIITYLNCDDAFEPCAFSHAIDCLKKSQADMIVGRLNVLNEMNNSNYIADPPVTLDAILDPLQNWFPQNPVSYFYKRSVQTQIGLFPIDNHYSMDYWFLLRAYKNNKIYKSEKILGTYYQLPNTKSVRYYESRLSLFDVLADFLIRNPEHQSQPHLNNFLNGILEDKKKLADLLVTYENELIFHRQRIHPFFDSKPLKLAKRFIKNIMPKG